MTYLWLVLVCLLFMGSPSVTFAHNQEILYCNKNIKIMKAVKLSEEIDSSNGMWREWYDTNDDGAPDIAALSHVTSVSLVKGEVVYQHNPHPVFWIVDIDYDGKPDKVYIDKRGLGGCNDIVLYQDLLAPLSGDSFFGKPPSQRGKSL